MLHSLIILDSMRTQDELLSIFKKNFVSGMINKDFNSFKKTHPTLMKAIAKTLIEIETTKKDT